MISPVQFCMKKVLPLNGHTNNTKRINYTAWSISSISTDPEPSAIVQKALTLNSHTKKTQRINNYSNYVVQKTIFRAIGYQSNSLGMGATNPKKSFSPHPPSKTDKYRQISSNKCENSHGLLQVLEESKPACPAYSSSRYSLPWFASLWVSSSWPAPNSRTQ